MGRKKIKIEKITNSRQKMVSRSSDTWLRTSARHCKRFASQAGCKGIFEFLYFL